MTARSPSGERLPPVSKSVMTPLLVPAGAPATTLTHLALVEKRGGEKQKWLGFQKLAAH
jgi:hypothetical protein